MPLAPWITLGLCKSVHKHFVIYKKFMEGKLFSAYCVAYRNALTWYLGLAKEKYYADLLPRNTRIIHTY